MKLYLIPLLFIFTVSITAAATIHGSIYDDQLETLNNVKLSINTEPKQTLISKDGQYIFNVNPGSYILKAEYYKSEFRKFSAIENINISSDGDYVIDLILFEIVDDDDLNNPELNIDTNIDFENHNNNFIYVLTISIFIILIILLIKHFKKNKSVNQIDYDNDAKLVLNAIKESGGRTTQKELRKKFQCSEAKISLILTELDHQNKIIKIKKGRGNIILIKK